MTERERERYGRLQLAQNIKRREVDTSTVDRRVLDATGAVVLVPRRAQRLAHARQIVVDGLAATDRRLEALIALEPDDVATLRLARRGLAAVARRLET